MALPPKDLSPAFQRSYEKKYLSLDEYQQKWLKQRCLDVIHQYRIDVEKYETDQTQANACYALGLFLRECDPVRRQEHEEYMRRMEERRQLEFAEYERRVSTARLRRKETARAQKERRGLLNQLGTAARGNYCCPRVVLAQAIEFERTHPQEPEDVDELLIEYGIARRDRNYWNPLGYDNP